MIQIKKKLGIGIVTLVAIAGFAGCLPRQQEKEVAEKPTPVVQEVKKEAPPKKVEKLSIENLNKIVVSPVSVVDGKLTVGDGGMSINQVRGILGKELTWKQKHVSGFQVDTLDWASHTENRSVRVLFTNGKATDVLHGAEGGELFNRGVK